MTSSRTVDALVLALPETAGSALYGMVDVLAAAGTLWNALVGEASDGPPAASAAGVLIRPRIVAAEPGSFRCGNGIPVTPDLAIGEAAHADIIVIPEIWLAPDDDLRDRHREIRAWICERYRGGSAIYAACSGAVLLAATGLLDGREATSHWAYEDLFRRRFPKVRFLPAPSLAFADPAGRIVTAGGTTSWHDLAIHIIARHCSPGEALRVAKVYLMKWHSEGQRPYASLVRRQPHADAVVRRAEEWLTKHFRDEHPVAGVVAACGIPERSLKRRFKTATGAALIDYVHNLRVEEAKRLLETGQAPFETIAAEVGYENPAFFGRLFKRSCGLTPGQYRRMFQPISAAAGG